MAVSSTPHHTTTHTVPPHFTTVPEDILTTENAPLITNSSCTAVGDPVPTITWLRADGTILVVNNDGEPQFGILTRSDSGVFACVASNAAGEIRHEFTVTVQGLYLCQSLYRVGPPLLMIRIVGRLIKVPSELGKCTLSVRSQ